MRLRLLALLVALSACMVLGVAGANTSGTAISGSVLVDGKLLQGAVVTVAGPHQLPIAQPTGAYGSFSIEPTSDGPYSLGVIASGYKSRALAGVTAGPLDPITLEPATYTPLPVYEGSASAVIADAASGVFYARMNSGPDVYRTIDYGGSWQLVTPSYDDPETGLTNTSGPSNIAAGGMPGEVVAASDRSCTNGDVDFTISLSTDYGLTWRKLDGASYNGSCTQQLLRLYWGHAGADTPDVLLAAVRLDDGSWKAWRADMSSASPRFVAEGSDPFGTGSVIDVASSRSGSFIGRVSATGGLSFAPLTATGSIQFGADEVTGLPHPLQFLRLGGAKESGAPPDGALAVGGSDPYKAVMITKDAGQASFAGASASAVTDLPGTGPGECAPSATDLRGGSVAPTSTGTHGFGSVETCWLQKSGSAMSVSPSGPDGGSVAYDALYGTGNLVSIAATMTYGPLKTAKLSPAGVPIFPDRMATGDAGPESGGYSIRGITSPEVLDTAYGPKDGELAVGADLAEMASKDRGKTMTYVLPIGGRMSQAVQWWQGASGEWLVFGHGNVSCNAMLTALLDWNGKPTGLLGSNVAGSDCPVLGGPSAGIEGFWDTGAYMIGALAPVPGSDTVFIGAGTAGEDKYGTGSHLFRARLVATNPPKLEDVVELSSPSVYLPQAMAYCPASSASEPMRDTLFVATGQTGFSSRDSKGSLLRIGDATGASPSATVVGSVAHDQTGTQLSDLRVDCARGVAYAGGQGLYKSVDGGQTFTRLSVTEPNGDPLGWVTAIGLNPADPNDVTVAGGQGGAVFHSTDGGTTWTLVHDPSVDRPSQVNDIEYAPGASSPTILGTAVASRGTRTISAARKAAATPKLALVGTSSGAFDGDLAAASGLMGLSARAGRRPGLEVRITTLASDSHPSLVATPSGTASAVFPRSNGLYLTRASSGSWSIPRQIPGTTARDDFPAAALDRSGRLYAAFARKGKGAGIYLATKTAKGAWSKPRRLSTRAGDTLPALALTGKAQVKIVFLRTRGSARGVYYVFSKAKGWSHAARVPGSNPADARPALGGPTLDARSNRLYLAFARSGRGIYLATMSGSSWSAPKRLTSVSGDSQPSLAIDSSGKVHIVFRRPRGRSAHGLYELQGKTAWSLRQIPKTTSTDREASLSVSGSTLALAFARPSGKSAGIYYDKVAQGRWLKKPERWSKSAKDRNPSLGFSAKGYLAVVYERG